MAKNMIHQCLCLDAKSNRTRKKVETPSLFADMPVEAPAAEAAAPAEEPKPKKRGRKTKAEKEAEEAAARAAEEAAAKKAPAKEEPQVAADEFVVPEAAEFAVGASEEDEATPNAIEQLREKMAANKVAEIASETPEEFSGERSQLLRIF